MSQLISACIFLSGLLPPYFIAAVFPATAPAIISLRVAYFHAVLYIIPSHFPVTLFIRRADSPPFFVALPHTTFLSRRARYTEYLLFPRDSLPFRHICSRVGPRCYSSSSIPVTPTSCSTYDDEIRNSITDGCNSKSATPATPGAINKPWEDKREKRR